MRYQVVWTTDAENDLANAWLAATDRNSITRAAAEIDAILAKSPNSLGESRTANVRITFIPPLAVEFEVLDQQQTVYVIAAWTYVIR